MRSIGSPLLLTHFFSTAISVLPSSKLTKEMTWLPGVRVMEIVPSSFPMTVISTVFSESFVTPATSPVSRIVYLYVLPTSSLVNVIVPKSMSATESPAAGVTATLVHGSPFLTGRGIAVLPGSSVISSAVTVNVQASPALNSFRRPDMLLAAFRSVSAVAV